MKYLLNEASTRPVKYDPTEFNIVEVGGNPCLQRYSGHADTVQIPDGIIEIGSTAFMNNKQLKKVELPDSLMVIGERAFSSCANLAEINFPKNLSLIAERAFFRCSALTNIKLPDSVKVIKTYAFGACAQLKTVDLGTGITNIRSRIFFKSGLEQLTTNGDPDNPYINSIGPEAFGSCKSLKEISFKNCLSFGESAFYSCENLRSLHIPNATLEIGKGIFLHCWALSSLTLPHNKKVRVLPPITCEYCKSLEEITIPGNILVVDNGAFIECQSLKKVIIEEGVEELGNEVFGACPNIQQLYLPASIEYIANDTFKEAHVKQVIYNGSAKWVVEYFKQCCDQVVNPAGVVLWEKP